MSYFFNHLNARKFLPTFNAQDQDRIWQLYIGSAVRAITSPPVHCRRNQSAKIRVKFTSLSPPQYYSVARSSLFLGNDLL